MAKTKNVTRSSDAIRDQNLLILERYVADVLISHGRISINRSTEYSVTLPRKDDRGNALFANNEEFLKLRNKMEKEIGNDAMNCIAIRRGKQKITTVEHLAKKLSKQWKHCWPLAT